MIWIAVLLSGTALLLFGCAASHAQKDLKTEDEEKNTLIAALLSTWMGS